MEKKIGSSCNNSFDCRAKKSASRMSKIFRKSDKYHSKKPGDMFHALAYFEYFYQYQLKKKEKRIARFTKYWPDKKKHGKTIVTLLKFNKARLKMREALGMNLGTSTEEAIQKFWIMGEYLNKGKVVEQKIHPDIKKRKKVLDKYKKEVRKFKSQIETLKETTEALKIKDIDALKDINNTNPLKGRSILVRSSITGLTQMGVIINSSRNSNVVTYMPSLYGIGIPQTAILIGNSKVKELASSSIEEVKDLNKDLKSLSKSEELKKEVTKEVAKDIINVVKLETRDFAYNVTRIENEIAEIKELAKEGTVDLESKAKELGFTSFAEGVEAYNKQNNTNYTVDEAKEALGAK